MHGTQARDIAIRSPNCSTQSSRPIYVVDAERRIVYCNPALADVARSGAEANRRAARRVPFGDRRPTTTGPRRFGAAHRFVPAAAGSGRRSHARARLVCLARDGRWCIGRRNSCRSTVRERRSQNAIDRADAREFGVSGAAGRRRHVAAGSCGRAVGRADGRRTAPHDPPVPPGQASRYSIESLLGDSSAMQKVRAQVAAAAASGANTLICGRHGSGPWHTLPGRFTTARRATTAEAACRSIANC